MVWESNKKDASEDKGYTKDKYTEEVIRLGGACGSDRHVSVPVQLSFAYLGTLGPDKQTNLTLFRQLRCNFLLYIRC